MLATGGSSSTSSSSILSESFSPWSRRSAAFVTLDKYFVMVFLRSAVTIFKVATALSSLCIVARRRIAALANEVEVWPGSRSTPSTKVKGSSVTTKSLESGDDQGCGRGPAGVRKPGLVTPPLFRASLTGTGIEGSTKETAEALESLLVETRGAGRLSFAV